MALGVACALAVSVALGLALGGSGGPTPSPAAASSGSEHAHPIFGGQDTPLDERTFIEAMIPHHALAIAMAQGALATTRDPRVTDVARDIAVEQPYEIDVMRDWRKEWLGVEEDAPASPLSPEMLHAMGMDVDLDALARSRPYGPAFYTAMIPHHQAAVAMARRLLLSDPHPRMRRLAEAMIRGQSEEIVRMRRYRAVALGDEQAARPAAVPTGSPVTP